jgi:hypothetical protein
MVVLIPYHAVILIYINSPSLRRGNSLRSDGNIIVSIKYPKCKSVYPGCLFFLCCVGSDVETGQDLK